MEDSVVCRMVLSVLHTATNTAALKYSSGTQTRTQRLIQASNEPGCQKTIDAPLSPAANSARSGWEFRCQRRTQRQRYRLVPSTIYGTEKKTKKKHKADSEMPPRDFLEELIYSI